jgi:hypothetical protein
MDERRFYQKPWFSISLWLLLGVGFYLWQIRRMGGLLPNFESVVGDSVLFFIGLLVWMTFFAQFVLPVRTFRERQNILNRLLAYLSGRHGPAIFIENGRVRESHGERKKKGPGVLWLDSASAAVTRNATSFKQTLGPGVHFTEDGEYIAGAVDLHQQNLSIGPGEGENPFEAQKDGQSENEYNLIQSRRLQVSAWTRDGIEVVPNISVTFKIDASPAKDEEEGSRFGFDPESVRKAITGEGINPNAPDDTPRRHVAWNQFPALIAADLWREYLSKFTWAELFEVSQPITTLTPTAPAPVPEEPRALPQPVAPSSGLEMSLAGIFYELNRILIGLGDRCERPEGKAEKHVLPDSKLVGEPEEIAEPQPETALQTINRMIKARMTAPKVIFLDESGKPGEDFIDSHEYKLLDRRGIKVISAGVSSLRFPPNIEDQLVHQWSTTWLDSAKADRQRIDRLRGFVELSGQVEAERQYAQSLSSNLLRNRPETEKDTLKVLMLRSRDELVKDDRMHRRASMEREELEELIQWVERGGQ